MDYQLIFRSKYGQLSAAMVLVIGIAFIAMIWGADGAAEALRSAVIPAALIYFTWWIWAWPCVIADRRGITVRNQLRTYRVSWDAFATAESHFGLYLTVEGHPGSSSGDDWEPSSVPPRRLYAAGVPARGGFTASRAKAQVPVALPTFTEGKTTTVREQPHTVAQILEEEKLYVSNPSRRMQVNGRGKDADAERVLLQDEPEFSGVESSPNLLQAGLLVVLVAGVVVFALT